MEHQTTRPDPANDPREQWAINDGQVGLLFDRTSMRLVPMEAKVASVLDEILRSAKVAPADSPAVDSLRDLLARFHRQKLPPLLEGLSPPVRSSVAASRSRRADSNRFLNTLAINVSNDCNLACTYCYANEGLYGTPERSLLGADDIENIIEKFAARYDYIAGVQFMGGEPSLNPAALERAGRVFQRLVDEGRLVATPRYTLVTNALSFKPRFLEVCRDLEIELTVSLDGPQPVHDAARLRRNGRGSYRSVRRNVDRALAAGISVDFEPTFSRAHLRNGVGLIDLVKWFHDEFDVRTLHAPPMSANRYETDGLGLSTEEKIREYCAVTEWGVDNVLERGVYLMHSYTARILTSLESRAENSHLCPAGVSLLSVSTAGEVSPCWMYTDEDDYSMGHVDQPGLLGAQANKVLDEISKWELHNHPVCNACMIQPLCFGCKGGDFHATQTASHRPGCDYMRAMVVTAMMRVFSRSEVPDSTAAYYDRPAFGATVYEGLRPDVEVGAAPAGIQQGLKPDDLVQLRVSRPSIARATE